VPRGGAIALTVGICALAATAVAAPRRFRTPGADLTAEIVNGVVTTDYAATGALLDGGTGSAASVTCSGTLIGCAKFLTAGHCVDGGLDPARYTVFFQHAGFFGVTGIARHPSYEFPIGDVAVLTLGAPVTGIRPIHLQADGPPPFGSAGTIVGFGRTGPGNEFGLKRRGSVTTNACGDGDGVSDATSVCWTFTSPLGTPGSNSNTCNADSGGPLLVTRSGSTARVLGGVTSGGSRATCLSGDHSYDVDVHAFASWIKSQAGTDLGGA